MRFGKIAPEPPPKPEPTEPRMVADYMPSPAHREAAGIGEDRTRPTRQVTVEIVAPKHGERPRTVVHNFEPDVDQEEINRVAQIYRGRKSGWFYSNINEDDSGRDVRAVQWYRFEDVRSITVERFSGDPVGETNAFRKPPP